MGPGTQAVIQSPDIEVKDVEARILTVLKDIHAVKGKQKTTNEMIKGTFVNDADYSKTKQQLEDAKRELKVCENRLSENSAVKRLHGDWDTRKKELKELNETLSMLLEVYYAKTKKPVIELAGTAVKIKTKYSLQVNKQMSLF